MSIKKKAEAIIFLGGDENKIKDLAKYFSISVEDMLKILAELREEKRDSGINLEIDQDIVYLVTNPLYGDDINKFFEQEAKPKKLSSASMETLSIIAYKQPVTKKEIELIRGVSVDRIVYNLEEKKFIRNCGKQEEGRKSNLYEITNKFLAYIGIKDIKELPDYEYLKEKLENKNLGVEETDENK